ncbi:hypothetical protein [Paraburkholderia sp. BL10I2N1]|uniref:hypothetical protein n=1 Tax=Paraburkholderia sp. BL10I2N1 TaxID=1938796 RepID=UPI0010618C18|nr:hypothetical protein [Paraburkholderia sp. BL10I2N1]TDN63661.1 hypothetical protein B0G77_7340 [Paraburkholderia sp. BL10I2N1]
MLESRLCSRLVAVITLACVASLVLNGCSTTITGPTPPAPAATLLNGGSDGVLVPLHVERSDGGQSRLGLPVQIDGKPVYLMLDSGTQGVRVLSSVLPRTGYPGAGGRTSIALANGAQVSGALVTLPVGLVGGKPVDLTAQAVDDVRCLPYARGCVAIDGYTGEFGWAFSGMAGIGAELPDDTCCTQPLRALPGNVGQRYLVHANLARPWLLLSPSKTITSGFTMTPMTSTTSGGKSTRQWPAGCVQIGDRMRFCAPVVFATGGAGMIRVETDQAPSWTPDDNEGKVLAQGNYNVALGVGSWVHRFDGAQVTIAKAKPGQNRIVVGLMALQKIDILFDFANGQLGLRAAQPVEALGG